METEVNDKLLSIYEKLLNRHGNPHWWPAKTPYEVIIGAVLTQNTAWRNVEKALANFGEELSPENIDSMPIDMLIEAIRPAGFFNQKAADLKAVTQWYGQYGYDARSVQKRPIGELRTELLSTKGIGQETADSILLYAFDLPTFVVDAYTNRLCSRHPINAGETYTAIKAYFENELPKNLEIYNSFHALIVINAKEYCRKKPLCDRCPLNGECERRCV
jgi:endonuclease-3 related protein